MSDEVQYLGLKLNFACDWVAVLDWGDGPDDWAAITVTRVIESRVRRSESVPQALRDAERDLANPHDHGVMYFSEVAQ